MLIEIVVVPNKSGSGYNVWELFGCDSHDIYFLHTVLEMEPRDLCMLVKHSTDEAHSQPLS